MEEADQKPIRSLTPTATHPHHPLSHPRSSSTQSSPPEQPSQHTAHAVSAQAPLHHSSQPPYATGYTYPYGPVPSQQQGSQANYTATYPPYPYGPRPAPQQSPNSPYTSGYPYPYGPMPNSQHPPYYLYPYYYPYVPYKHPSTTTPYQPYSYQSSTVLPTAATATYQDSPYRPSTSFPPSWSGNQSPNSNMDKRKRGEDIDFKIYIPKLAKINERDIAPRDQKSLKEDKHGAFGQLLSALVLELNRFKDIAYTGHIGHTGAGKRKSGMKPLSRAERKWAEQVAKEAEGSAVGHKVRKDELVPNPKQIAQYEQLLEQRWHLEYFKKYIDGQYTRQAVPEADGLDVTEFDTKIIHLRTVVVPDGKKVQPGWALEITKTSYHSDWGFYSGIRIKITSDLVASVQVNWQPYLRKDIDSFGRFCSVVEHMSSRSCHQACSGISSFSQFRLVLKSTDTFWKSEFPEADIAHSSHCEIWFKPTTYQQQQTAVRCSKCQDFLDNLFRRSNEKNSSQDSDEETDTENKSTRYELEGVRSSSTISSPKRSVPGYPTAYAVGGNVRAPTMAKQFGPNPLSFQTPLPEIARAYALTRKESSGTRHPMEYDAVGSPQVGAPAAPVSEGHREGERAVPYDSTTEPVLVPLPYNNVKHEDGKA